MVYGRYNELVNDLMGVLLLFINQLTTGGPHPVWIKIKLWKCRMSFPTWAPIHTAMILN